MRISEQPHHSSLSIEWNASAVLFRLVVVAVLVLLVAITAHPAQGQTYQVLHNFTGGVDGGYPFGGLTVDASGSLYGTTCGGACGNSPGTVFKLIKKGSHYVFSTLYIFPGDPGPSGRVIFGPDGTLYGTTFQGGSDSSGTVFNLTPPATASPNVFGGWTETDIHVFGSGGDGSSPQIGDLVFDNQGNIYGVACGGGASGAGAAYELTPSSGGWSETILYSFTGGADGLCPLGTFIFDGLGNLYSTAWQGGGSGYGTVFELTRSGSSWQEQTLHSFQGGADGATPIGGVLMDYSALIVSTTQQGSAGGGTVAWLNNSMFQYQLPGAPGTYSGPWGTLVGTSTDLYGTTYADGAYSQGSVFNLAGCAGWGYTSLHDFSGPDGAYPAANVILDSDGDLFGTTSQGGAYGYGVVFEITPAQQSDGLHPDSGCF
jgi:uncharacterized repeat protein (TIGR03803 family)